MDDGRVRPLAGHGARVLHVRGGVGRGGEVLQPQPLASRAHMAAAESHVTPGRPPAPSRPSNESRQAGATATAAEFRACAAATAAGAERDRHVEAESRRLRRPQQAHYDAGGVGEDAHVQPEDVAHGRVAPGLLQPRQGPAQHEGQGR